MSLSSPTATTRAASCQLPPCCCRLADIVSSRNTVKYLLLTCIAPQNKPQTAVMGLSHTLAAVKRILSAANLLGLLMFVCWYFQGLTGDKNQHRQPLRTSVWKGAAIGFTPFHSRCHVYFILVAADGSDALLSCF